MLIIKDNDRFYFVSSSHLTIGEGQFDQALVPENMPFFKAKRASVVIAGLNNADVDALRYLSIPFPAELTLPNIHNKVMPKIATTLIDLGRADEDGDISPLFFGKKDRAFMVCPDGTLKEMENAEAYGWRESYFNYALSLTDGMPLLERIQKVHKIVGKITGSNLFPLTMIDSKDFKIRIVEEEI